MTFQEILHDENIRITGIIIGVIFIVGNLIEFFYSYFKQKKYYSFKALIINFSLALLQQLTDVFNKLIFFAGFIFIQQNYSVQHLFNWSEIKVGFPLVFHNTFPFVTFDLYMVFIWVFILIVADFCQYWLHRLSHEVNIMWAGHIVHHSMEEYNYSVALRQSFIESIYTWIFYLPLAFFGIPWQLFIMAYAISLIWQFLVHTRLVNKLGLLEQILATPSHHRVHHGKNAQYIDKNYGALFIVWDKLFGTFEPEVEAVDYGVTVPLQSQNPIWINTHHHLHILKMFFKTKGLKNKLQLILGKPSFIPSDLVNEYEQLKLLKTPKVSSIPTIKSFYLFINFLLTALAGFLLVNYYQETFNVVFFLPLAVVVAGSFVINIALLENKKWADYAEVIRLILIFMAGITLLLHTGHNNLLAILLTGIPVFMLFQTWVIAKSYHKMLITAPQT